jgi:uncharacterized protein with FMN-binding domain
MEAKNQALKVKNQIIEAEIEIETLETNLRTIEYERAIVKSTFLLNHQGFDIDTISQKTTVSKTIIEELLSKYDFKLSPPQPSEG